MIKESFILDKPRPNLDFFCNLGWRTKAILEESQTSFDKNTDVLCHNSLADTLFQSHYSIQVRWCRSSFNTSTEPFLRNARAKKPGRGVAYTFGYTGYHEYEGKRILLKVNKVHSSFYDRERPITWLWKRNQSGSKHFPALWAGAAGCDSRPCSTFSALGPRGDHPALSYLLSPPYF